MDGGELFYHLRKVFRFTEEVVRFYAAEILLAITYMHENNFIYRFCRLIVMFKLSDLKPENIMLDRKGHIRLTDFGLSKIMAENEDTAFSLCGTPEYLAPEILTTSSFFFNLVY
jgi:serine/threonine protein kinase